LAACAPGVASRGNSLPKATPAAALRSGAGYPTRVARAMRLGLHFANGVGLAALVYPHCAADRQHGHDLALVEVPAAYRQFPIAWSRQAFPRKRRSSCCRRRDRALSSSCNTVRGRLFFGRMRKTLADRRLAWLWRKCAQGYPQKLWMILPTSRIARAFAYSHFCDQPTRFDAWSKSEFSLLGPGSRLQA